jgi:AraC-like DNA-binding protein
MNSFYNVFFTGIIFYSFITGIILLFKKREQAFTSRLLGFILLALGWYAMVYLLIITRLLIQLPYTYRILSPIYYLIPPFSYFYVRSILGGETRFRKSDWPHFILAAINFIDLLPYYFSSSEYKQGVTEAVANNLLKSYQVSSGIFPDVIHFVLRPVQGIIYLLFQWHLLYVVGMKKREDYKSLLQKGGDWLIMFTFFVSVIYGGTAYISLTGFHYGSEKTNMVVMIECLAFFGMSFHLFFKPDILYGHPAMAKSYPREMLQNEITADDVTPASIKLSSEYINACVLKLGNYMTEKELFRQQGISINELATALKIPSTNLSYVLNRHYGQRFNEFINTCRVNYVIQRFRRDDWQELTLEGLAQESGFTSRSAFFASFKKVTGVTPSKYLLKTGQAEISTI